MNEGAVRAELEKILASRGFVGSERLRTFLRFVVERSLAGHADQIKEYVIGIEVYHRDSSYDPRLDATVRVEASKLRTRLDQYYETEGQQDSVRITIPKGSYVPVFQESTAGSERPRPRPVLSRVQVTAAVGVLLIVAAGMLWWNIGGRVSSRPKLSLFRLTSDGGLTSYPALSPDGRLAAYASDRAGNGDLDIWVQPVASREAIRLTREPADDYDPVFSHDGSRIAFCSYGKVRGIHMVSALGGGDPWPVAREGWRPTFSPDGRWITYYAGARLDIPPTKIYRVRAEGGTPEPLEIGIGWSALPVWSPDGKSILFVGGLDAQTGQSDWDWWTVSSDGGRAVKTGASEIFRQHGLTGFRLGRVAFGLGSHGFGDAIAPGCWIGNRVIFSARAVSDDSVNLWEIPVQPSDGRIAGIPERLTTGSAWELLPRAATAGQVAFASLSSRSDLWALPIDANEGRVAGQVERLTNNGADNWRPSVSTDGKRLVFGSNRSGNFDVWLRDLETGKETQLTATPRDETHARISPDGSKVTYSVEEDRKVSIYIIEITSAPDGSVYPRLPERVCENCGRPLDWSPDSARILFWWGSPIRFSSLDLRTRQRVDVISHPENNILRAQFSPDGCWLVFHMLLESNRSPIHVAPLRNGIAGGPSEWFRVTDGTEGHPLWSPDGNLLYFASRRDGFGCIWKQRLDPTTKKAVGSPSDFLHFHNSRWSANMYFGGATVKDRLFYSLTETTGNIWLAKIEDQR